LESLADASGGEHQVKRITKLLNVEMSLNKQDSLQTNLQKVNDAVAHHLKILGCCNAVKYFFKRVV
jgi:hypothetical protein